MNFASRSSLGSHAAFLPSCMPSLTSDYWSWWIGGWPRLLRLFLSCLVPFVMPFFFVQVLFWFRFGLLLANGWTSREGDMDTPKSSSCHHSRRWPCTFITGSLWWSGVGRPRRASRAIIDSRIWTTECKPNRSLLAHVRSKQLVLH